MSTEATIAFQWLYTVLSGDSQLTALAPGGVWRSMAPPETSTPFVIFALQSATDSITMNAFRMLVEGLFQVKAVGPASESTAIANAAARIDALIGSPPTSGTVTGGYIAASYRQSALSIDELVNGELWLNQGGMYHLTIEQSS